MIIFPEEKMSCIHNCRESTVMGRQRRQLDAKIGGTI